MAIRLPNPDIQMAFAERLVFWRARMLQPALMEAIRALSIDDVDRETAEFVPSQGRSLMAACGLRAELVFPVPVLLRHAPRLVGYYRLVMGYSQKAFYTKEAGTAPLRMMEEKGKVNSLCDRLLPAFCGAMSKAGVRLVESIAPGQLSAGLINDLALLTLGAQLRGSANNLIGKRGTRQVFHLMRTLLQSHIIEEKDTMITIHNAAGRRVTIEFASDPDIVIREEMSTGAERSIIAVEIKGGRDYSNIHNRVGEAEKSHQKARKRGFVECWTIVNVPSFREEVLRRESPSTDRFFRLGELVKNSGQEFEDFRSRLVALTGVP